jgi:hypothetical protein
MGQIGAPRDASCQHAAELLELLETEGASPRFFQGFEEANAKTRELVVRWLTMTLDHPKRARGHSR